MMTCKQCGKDNSLDSKFCRACGVAFPAEEIKAAIEANEQLVTDGQRMLADGRLPEALILAETAHENNPDSPSALALMGECKERYGKYDEALDCFEKVLALTPDSALDRIKVQYLRKQLAAQALEAEPDPASRRNAILAGVAAVALVACIGAAFALRGTGDKTALASTKPELLAKNDVSQSQPFTDPASRVVGVPSETPNTEQKTAEQPKVKEVPRSSARKTTSVAPGPDLRGVPSGPTLPRPVRNGSTTTEEASGNTPVRPPVGDIKIVPSGQKPDKKAEKPNVPPVPKTPKPKPFNPGLIEMRASASNPKTVGGSETSTPTKAMNDEGKNAKTLMAVAQNNMLTKNFGAAADAYEKALQSGASPGMANLRLGQCYQEMGRKGDALNAYQKAERAFQSALTHDPENTRLRDALDVARSAIKLLGG